MTCSPEDNGHCTSLYSGLGKFEPTLTAFRRLHPSAEFFMWVFSILSGIYIIFWAIQSLANSHRYKGSTNSNNLRNKLIRCIIHQKIFETEEEAQKAVEASKLISYTCLKSTADDTQQLLEDSEPTPSDQTTALSESTISKEPTPSDQTTALDESITLDHTTISDELTISSESITSDQTTKPSMHFKNLKDASKTILRMKKSKSIKLKNRFNPNKAVKYNFTSDEITMISDELDKLYEVDLWLYNKIYAIPAFINALIHKVGVACIIMTLFIFSYYILPIWLIRTGIYVEMNKTSLFSENN
ncbi:hypothetical protein NEPAR06_2085 [Nematocida parisii]|uniref:Uncharacterized protein n=1 Tax=Nematocida parisii (strain ERTm3) TaxID=935791 RepID=I3EI07_NEMP3|nr:uncharacterized protein NEPG_02451 [Nematocida parisii ERTm1]EIJ88854.1 hypothetical protein NEQG_00673 [Nematocida parisii ERTm3]KAI5146045.1 hypothetical protein NEPAR07_2061 [Nematocida parisii]EIJ92760.1 hypothetical protein NEPG_02451 [Nematocida parisii ERTm1]KAI5155964.1 hypothetical protein NEPAR06_2085 [Nematocida parisii]KAI5158629.1 hypothetical protein NEPAR05_2156 [Nematocida parisii]|eukprot:XP_013060278.1 hypothetical protein NEPG_02451 [Nematocida parisii ERTm1]